MQKINTPFKIGHATFKHRLIQAPLAGISCAPFRELFSRYTAPAYAVTEMISAQSLIQHERLKPRYLARSSKEGALAIQLSGHDPILLAEAIATATTYEPDVIDLNCGCPQPKIRGKGCGSALTDTPQQFEKVLKAIREATSLPLTVKIRTAGNTTDMGFLDIAHIAEQSGVDAIIVHGRHHSEGYDVAANYQQIKAVVERVNIPVIANGDVGDKASLERCLSETGADAIMIARGSIGKPWLFQQLLDGTSTPVLLERLKVFQLHVQRLATIENSEHLALLQARRLLKWYFPEASETILAACYALNPLEEVMTELQELTENRLV